MYEVIEQNTVIEFLSRPSSYGAGRGPVERIDTHAAIIFLVGGDAYKIKRAVRFSYLDFSTLEKRLAACKREIEINMLFAGSLYKGVVAITQGQRDAMSPDGLKIGGTGKPVEYAVHMRRFEQADLLGNRARRGELSPELIKAIADKIAASHELAPVSQGLDGTAQFRRLLRQLSEGFAAEPNIFPATKRQHFAELAEAATIRAEHALRLRSERGLVRRCHGDLHLDNIVICSGEPLLFDAIEFNEDIATIDVLYDLAFVLMDLDRLGQRRAANLLLNRYLYRASSDLSIYGLIAMPLFLACRAGVRAMVAAQRARAGRADTAADTAKDTANATSALAVQEAKQLFASTLDYLQPEQPLLVAIGGLSGSGKSTLAARLAPHLGAAPGALHLRSDLERKSIFGVAETDRLASRHYSGEINRKVYDYLARKAQLGLHAGRAVIVDAVYSNQVERDAIAEVARAAGRRFVGIWLSTDRERLIARVAARKGDASDATEAVIAGQIEHGTGPISWNLVDASGRPEEICDAARYLIEIK